MARIAPQMTDDDLAAILQTEEADAASYYSSELAGHQAEAMDAYHGKLKDDVHLPNRSKVVTGDIRDTINWMMPSLMDAFAPSDELITCTDDNLVDDNNEEKDAANYLTHVYFKDNKGQIITHDFAFDALLQRVGILRVYWCDPEPKPPMVLEGITIDNLIRYVNDTEYQIIGWSQDGAIEIEAENEADGEDERETDEHNGGILVKSDEAGEVEEGEPTFTIQVQHTPRMGRAKIEVVPPEEFRFSRRARSIAEADYHGWKHETFLADLKRQFPEKAHELDGGDGNASVKSSEIDSETDERIVARFPDEPDTFSRGTINDEPRKKVWEHIEYVRVDFDGDGITELRRVRRVGNVLLENDVAAESEFVAWTPNRISHRMVGMSVHDLLADIQRIRTALMRRAMDGLARSTAPRTFINSMAMGDDPTLLDRILDHDIGDAIPVKGNPRDLLYQEVTPDVSQYAFTAVEYFDRRSEEASGVNRHAMGIQPQAITDTKGGIENLQAAANTRIALVARWLGYGLEEALGKVLRILVRHQDHARVVKINGRRMRIDPRMWSDEMGVAVHVGMAGESREKKLVYLNGILAVQERAYTQLGHGNPFVTLHHVSNTASLMANAMGYKDSRRFFGEVPKNWQPPEAGKDPKQAEVEGKLQLQQAEMQQRGQIETQKLQGQLQIQQAEKQAKQQIAAQDVEVQRALAEAKAQSDRDAAVLKADSDMKIAQMRMDMEARIASERLASEMEFARWKAQLEASQRSQIGAGETDRLPANRSGGRLDA